MKHQLLGVAVLAAIVPLLGIMANFPVQAPIVAQASEQFNQSDLSQVQFTPPQPPSSDAPRGRARGGASRGSCSSSEISLTALVPTIEAQSTNPAQSSPVLLVWGQTTLAQPTLWFYVPYGAKNPHRLEFRLEDLQGKELYRARITAPLQPSYLSVSLPKLVTLNPGQDYEWSFRAQCEESLDSSPIKVSGLISRVSLSSELAREVERATPAQRVILYAQNGIWFDALDALAKLRLADPSNAELIAAWKSLLMTAKMPEDLPLTPIVSSSSPR